MTRIRLMASHFGGAAADSSTQQSRPGAMPTGGIQEGSVLRDTLRPAEGWQTGSDGYSSGVSWGAVIGGAFVAAALSLILLALGAGFGLSSVSPWSNNSASTSTLGTEAIVWLIFIQIVARAMGGYLAGRLRARWVSVHTHEVHFRDTANGFLVWAVGVVITVTLLASAAATMVGGSPQEAKIAVDPNAYFVDTLFRSSPPKLDFPGRPEAERIFARALSQSAVPATDKTYLGGLVAAQTGLTQSEGETRVAIVIADAQLAAETARKATARLLLWLFVALLIGAFSASFAATIGGRQRDHVEFN